jgi:hypothetical protein
MQRAGFPVSSSNAITPSAHTSTASCRAIHLVYKLIPNTRKQCKMRLRKYKCKNLSKWALARSPILRAVPKQDSLLTAALPTQVAAWKHDAAFSRLVSRGKTLQLGFHKSLPIGAEMSERDSTDHNVEFLKTPAALKKRNLTDRFKCHVKEAT